jgi:aldehyde:ferredoxin oxidoreductase
MDVKGVVNRIGVIDLGKNEIGYEPLSKELVRDYLGGYGIGAHFILQRQAAGVDPLGPEAWLGFTTGPLTGTDACGGNRFTVVGKSPKTNGWGDANCGGKFGPHMKRAGFDHLFFTGIAPEPVIVVLEGGRAEIKPAGDLWGLGCIETEDRLEAEYGPKTSVACIGQAGENVSLLACVINDRGRAAGRSGLGAVMGAKKLKAIVARGTGEVAVA